MPATRSEETRRRLLEAATSVFAGQGFHKASTRTIAQRAGANIALIHYHFGDKAGLYRAIFAERFRAHDDGLATLIKGEPTFAEVYPRLIRRLLNSPDDFRLLARREEIEPTGLLGQEWLQPLRKGHDLLVATLCRELGLAKPDIEVERLAFTLVGMATIFGHNQPIIRMLAPEVLAPTDWIDSTIERLIRQASVLIQAERAIRASHRPTRAKRPSSRSSS
ncbi:MAG TPA: CerR family C-terminal domain-containing protein [Opitutaceae bacterium]